MVAPFGLGCQAKSLTLGPAKELQTIMFPPPCLKVVTLMNHPFAQHTKSLCDELLVGWNEQISQIVMDWGTKSKIQFRREIGNHLL